MSIVRQRRDFLRLAGRVVAGVSAASVLWPAAVGHGAAHDENLPDTSTYGSFLHPDPNDLDYVRDLYGRADRLTAAPLFDNVIAMISGALFAR